MRTDRVKWILLILATALGWCSGTNTSFVNGSEKRLKILGVFGHLGKSHFDVFRPIVEALARKGHDVTVISFFPRTAEAKAKEPLPTYKDVTLYDENFGVFVDVVDLKDVDHTITKVMTDLRSLKMMATASCDVGLRSKQLREFLKTDQHFDVILTEQFNTECYLGVINRFPAPFIMMSSHQILPVGSGRLGDPDETSYVPGTMLGLRRPLSFIDRVCNTIVVHLARVAWELSIFPASRRIAEETFGPQLPNLGDIARNASALLVNTHPSLHGVRPHLPNVIEIGGVHIPSTVKPLPADIKKFLDDAKEGVLYFNLGSMIKAASLPKEKLDIIIKVMGSLPRKVLWKWEADDLPNRPKNVLVRKWLPQFDILNHPNVKCYLGHGGLLGLSEGVYTGVPMILMPMYGDQFHNSAAAEMRGAAIVVQYNELNEKTLRHAIDEIFNNTRYRENARQLSKAFRDRPANPLDTAVWWTEYIARGYAVPYLRNEGANLAWYQRHLVDVGLFLIAVVLLVLYIASRLIKLLLSALGVFKGQKAKAVNANYRNGKKHN